MIEIAIFGNDYLWCKHVFFQLWFVSLMKTEFLCLSILLKITKLKYKWTIVIILYYIGAYRNFRLLLSQILRRWIALVAVDRTFHCAKCRTLGRAGLPSFPTEDSTSFTIEQKLIDPSNPQIFSRSTSIIHM